MLRHRKCIARSPPYIGPVMTLRWLMFSWVPRKSYGGLTASLRGHRVLLQRLYSELVVVATTVSVVRSEYSCLPVSLQLPYGFLSHESYHHHTVAVTFVTTTTTAHKNLWFWKITFTNCRPQNHTATIQPQHDMWPRHYQDCLCLLCLLWVSIDPFYKNHAMLLQ